jgi:hypothetical protein
MKTNGASYWAIDAARRAEMERRIADVARRSTDAEDSTYGYGMETTSAPLTRMAAKSHFDPEIGPSLADIALKGSVLVTRVEPWSDNVRARGFIKVYCEGQGGTETHKYINFLKDGAPSFEGDEYNNFLLISEEDGQGRIHTLRWTPATKKFFASRGGKAAL